MDDYDDDEPMNRAVREFAEANGISVSVRTHDEETNSSGLLTYESRVNVTKVAGDGMKSVVSAFVPNLHRYADDSLPAPLLEDVLVGIGLLVRAAVTGIVKPGDEQYEKAMTVMQSVMATMGPKVGTEFLGLFGLVQQAAPV